MNEHEKIRRRDFLATVSTVGSIGLLGPALAGRALGADRDEEARNHPAFRVQSQVALGQVGPANWAPYVGSVFRVHLPNNRFIHVTLAGTKLFPPLPPKFQAPVQFRRAPYAVRFQAQQGQPALTQDTYVMEHPQIGVFPLFIVPMGSSGSYEAVFG